MDACVLIASSTVCCAFNVLSASASADGSGIEYRDIGDHTLTRLREVILNKSGQQSIDARLAPNYLLLATPATSDGAIIVVTMKESLEVVLDHTFEVTKRTLFEICKTRGYKLFRLLDTFVESHELRR